jgi:hypothetical protein
LFGIAAMRFLIIIGSPECPHLGLAKLENGGGDVNAVARLLCAESQGFSRALTEELPIGSPSAVIRDELGDWF